MFKILFEKLFRPSEKDQNKNILKKVNPLCQWHLRAKCNHCSWSTAIDKDDSIALLELAGFKKKPEGGWASAKASSNLCQGCGIRIIYDLKNDYKVTGYAYRTTWDRNFRIVSARLIDEDSNKYEFRKD